MTSSRSGIILPALSINVSFERKLDFVSVLVILTILFEDANFFSYFISNELLNPDIKFAYQ